MAYFAVIGAGLAGMSLAKCLEREGHRCTIFEKSRGRGGRLSTRRLDGWQADHGAQYFTARTEAFKTEVDHWVQQGWVQQWSVEPWKLSIGEFTKSPDSEKRFVGTPTMNAMVHGLSKESDLQLNRRIKRLEKQGASWLLWDDKELQLGEFDGVLITAPLAQAVELLPTNSSALTETRQASMTPTWAVGIAFKEATGIEADAVFVNKASDEVKIDSAISWLAKDSSKPSRATRYETWMCHFSPSWTQNNLDASEELLLSESLSVLQAMLNKTQPNRLLSEVHESFKHRWLYARSGVSEPLLSAWDSEQKIGLAGDWTVGGRVEGAWQSAQQLAQQIIDDYH